MCLIALAIRAHPRYPLIVAANRDEFYHRPTAPLSFWPDHPEILAGRDLEQNGTWLGVTQTGRVAAITNFREPAAMNKSAPSRGLLVSDFLISDQSPADYLRAVRDSGKEYNGFNLVAGDVRELWWYSNKKQDIVKIPPGVHAISNHLLDTVWPKTRKITAGLETMCRENQPLDPEAVFSLLTDTTRPPDRDLPDTGVGLSWERMLSPVFVSSDIYGTRSSAVFLWDHRGKMMFAERTYVPGKIPAAMEKEKTYEIMLPPAAGEKL